MKKQAEKQATEQTQPQAQSQVQTQGREPGDVQKTFRGRELTADQRDSFREGKTVYMDGLQDRNGKGYNGYITLNRETGKADFMFSKQYKDACRRKSHPRRPPQGAGYQKQETV